MNKTLQQYDEIMANSRNIFVNKNRDYGTSWRILRPSSLTDQMFIKAKRIRTIEEKGTQKVGDDIADDYRAMINYGYLAIMQLELDEHTPLEMETEEVLRLYDNNAHVTRELLQQKNHDYGEVWRDMRISSITDLILAKILRIKQIEDNKGKTTVSEGLASNYMDIIIYSAFSLIKLMEQNQES